MENIKVTVVDLTSTLQDGSEESCVERLEDVLDEAFVSCTTAQSFIARQAPAGKHSLCCLVPSQSNAEKDTSTEIKSKIARYVKVSDKYIAFTSILLKSRAFHLAYQQTHDNIEESEGGLPVVDLPRTEHGKPFIPLSPNSKGDFSTDTEGTYFPISVSHQFPFVGIAQLRSPGSTSSQADGNMSVGMDIVVFDKVNKKLYNTTEDFVNVFRDNFTDWEWSRITEHGAHDEHLLKEFYLRWAVKESYTKALGMGMGIDFSSFETRLQGIDNDTSSGLWPWVASGHETVMRGTVTWKEGKDESDIWSFFFLPLCDADGAMVGCYSLCVGPSHNGDKNGFPPETELISLSELVTWHQQFTGERVLQREQVESIC